MCVIIVLVMASSRTASFHKHPKCCGDDLRQSVLLLDGLKSGNVSLRCGATYCARILQRGSDQGIVTKLFDIYRTDLQVPTQKLKACVCLWHHVLFTAWISNEVIWHHYVKQFTVFSAKDSHLSHEQNLTRWLWVLHTFRSTPCWKRPLTSLDGLGLVLPLDQRETRISLGDVFLFTFTFVIALIFSNSIGRLIWVHSVRSWDSENNNNNNNKQQQLGSPPF